jgi:phosphatidylglycerophosphate synthase
VSKLSSESKFFDVSDYGRPIAVFVAQRLKNTSATPVQVTLVFGLCGIFAIYNILNNNYLTAGVLLILKSIIDAIDGELSRVKNRPSYTGRYLDSVFDIILNFFFLLAICSVTQGSLLMTLFAFFAIQLQGTLYNYYYVILRNNTLGGDTTSKIFEQERPIAFPYENQRVVNILFFIYIILYGIFDKIIYILDYDAHQQKKFPNWFMTCVSTYGLGFQLLLMAVMLACGWVHFIIPFFIGFTIFLFFFIGMRKLYFS